MTAVQGRQHTFAVLTCSSSELTRAVQLSMRAFKSATFSRYSASFVACPKRHQPH
jgi:hypothetical protein